MVAVSKFFANITVGATGANYGKCTNFVYFISATALFEKVDCIVVAEASECSPGVFKSYLRFKQHFTCCPILWQKPKHSLFAG